MKKVIVMLSLVALVCVLGFKARAFGPGVGSSGGELSNVAIAGSKKVQGKKLSLSPQVDYELDCVKRCAFSDIPYYWCLGNCLIELEAAEDSDEYDGIYAEEDEVQGSGYLKVVKPTKNGIETVGTSTPAVEEAMVTIDEEIYDMEKKVCEGIIEDWSTGNKAFNVPCLCTKYCDDIHDYSSLPFLSLNDIFECRSKTALCVLLNVPAPS